MLLFTLLRMAAVFVSPLPLQVDEAQYAGWAHAIAAGYYSKPPFIAWLLSGGQQMCSLFGVEAVEGCTRMLQAPAFLLTALAIMATAWHLYASVAVTLAAGVLFLTLPLSGFYAQVASTDAWLLLWWALALWAFVKTQQFWPNFMTLQSGVDESKFAHMRHDAAAVSAQGTAGWWLLCGIFIGLGMLTKYSMAVFAASLVFYILYVELKRGASLSATLRAVFQPRLWLCGGVALLVFSPNLIWNFQNGFPTFQHHVAISQVAEVQSAGWQPQHGLASLLRFLGLQFVVFGPLCFGFLLKMSVSRPSAPSASPVTYGAKSAADALLLNFVWPMLGLILLQALLSRAHANWAVPAYIAATILLAAYWWLPRSDAQNRPELAKFWRGRWAYMISVLIGLVFALICMLSPIAIGKGWLPTLADSDFIHKISGWREYAVWARQQATAQKPALRVIAEDRELLAALSVYAWPEVQHPLAWNPYRRKENHYQWFYDLSAARLDPDEAMLILLVDEEGVALSYEAMHARRITQLERSFREVQGLEDATLSVLRLGRAQGRAHAFLVKGFRGYP